MTHYIHHVPGRLRVRCKSLRFNPARLEDLGHVMALQSGVTDVTINPNAGSITIQYDVGATGQDQLVETLNAQGCAAETAGRTASKARSLPAGAFIGETVTRTVIGTIVGSVVKSAVEPQLLTALRAVRLAR